MFFSLALPAAHQHLLPGDELVYRAILEERSPLLNAFFHAVTKAGSSKVLVPVGVGVLLWQRNNWRLLLFLLFYSFGVAVLEIGAKYMVARPRPHQYFVSGPPLHSSHGFPSDHVLAAAAFYGMLLVLLRKAVRHRSWQWGIMGGILLLILLVGLSRIYRGAHWPSDVLGGYALGGAYCLLATVGYEWIENQQPKKLDRS